MRPNTKALHALAKTLGDAVGRDTDADLKVLSEKITAKLTEVTEKYKLTAAERTVVISLMTIKEASKTITEAATEPMMKVVAGLFISTLHHNVVQIMHALAGNEKNDDLKRMFAAADELSDSTDSAVSGVAASRDRYDDLR